MTSSELEYCLKRAREEELRAMRCAAPEAAAAHHGMSVRYSARAFMLHAVDREKSEARPIETGPIQSVML